MKKHRPEHASPRDPVPPRPNAAGRGSATAPDEPRPVPDSPVSSGNESIAKGEGRLPADEGTLEAVTESSAAETLSSDPPERAVLETPSDAEARAADYLDQLQRLKAEFDNYRKRTAKEREVWFVQAQAEVAESLLPVLDDLRRAREHEKPGADGKADGWWLIFKRFEETLERLGLETQGVEPGCAFDPELHDAMMAEPSADHPEGTIIRVLEPGYLYRGRLLRRSRISCSSGPPGE